jgi:hypothetical protein
LLRNIEDGLCVELLPLPETTHKNNFKADLCCKQLKNKPVQKTGTIFLGKSGVNAQTMSKEVGNKLGGERDMSRLTIGSGQRINYEGFEGMNYEQFRKPYDPNHSSRNSRNDERKESKRPDEA